MKVYGRRQKLQDNVMKCRRITLYIICVIAIITVFILLKNG